MGGKMFRQLTRLAGLAGLIYVGVVAVVALRQRQMVFFPSHTEEDAGLAAWRIDGEWVGLARVPRQPKAVWLLLHGNGGQASDRSDALGCFDADDAVYLLEYPGYGPRPGSPSRRAIDAAAEQAYLELRRRHPGLAVGVAGESLGSGPAAFLGTMRPAPDLIVLVVPFADLPSLAAERMPWLPARWLLLDRWDNVAALRAFDGPVEIYAARKDVVIPIHHARRLADAVPRCLWREIDGEHGDWPFSGQVRFRMQSPDDRVLSTRRSVTVVD